VQSATASSGFVASFAWLVLIFLIVLVFICDALPAISEALFPGDEVAMGPIASLVALAGAYFWPGTVLVHAGLATLWLACGTWRFSVRILIVILSMSARALWIWRLYGLNEPHQTHTGEPFIVSGAPVLFFAITWLTSMAFIFERFRGNTGISERRAKLQILDLIVWTAAIALLLGPAVSFFRVLTPAILKERLQYDSTSIMASSILTWFSAMLLREWFLNAPLVARIQRLGWLAVALFVTCALLILSAHFLSKLGAIAQIGAQDMAENILPYLLPSTLAWCMAVGWALRELGVRIEKRPSPARDR
jgi:hypothetical protein